MTYRFTENQRKEYYEFVKANLEMHPTQIAEHLNISAGAVANIRRNLGLINNTNKRPKGTWYQEQRNKEMEKPMNCKPPKNESTGFQTYDWNNAVDRQRFRQGVQDMLTRKS
jgi:hypothetical protein